MILDAKTWVSKTPSLKQLDSRENWKLPGVAGDDAKDERVREEEEVVWDQG